MTIREPDLASAPVSEEEFFDSAPESEDNLPFDLRPIDPILVRKMTPDVRVRRRRLARLVVGVVGCSALLLLAALAHVHLTVGSNAATTEGTGTEMQATVTAPAAPR